MALLASLAADRGKRWLWIGATVAAALAFGTLAGVGFASAIQMPQIEMLAEFTPSLTTQLVDRHGETFASFARERRYLLGETEIPPLVEQAVVAAEDRNFFAHGGVDPQGVLRAVLRNLSTGSRIGGSTLTMQLARKLFLTPEKTWRRKIEEAFLTVEMEKRLSKQQILALYCNVMFLGHGNYGIEAAARDFFRKPAEELDAAEAATLVGILQRPSDYSPYRRPDLVINRRNYVLRRMAEDGYLSRADLKEALARPLGVAPRQRPAQVAPFFAEEVRRDLERRYGSDALLQKGLVVETTLDPAIQQAAVAAFRQGLVALDRGKGWRGAPGEVAAGLDPDSVELDFWGLVQEDPGAWRQGVVVAADARRARVRLGAETLELGREGIAWTRKARPDAVLERGDIAWFSVVEGEGDGARPELRLEQVPELQGAVVVLESATGAVRAMVGGWDFDSSEFNRATQAKRQVGSAFKPFVFGAALEAGYTAADTLFDAPAAFPGPTAELTYSPRNYYRNYHGITTLRRALEQSMNVSAVKLMDIVGAPAVIDFARRCGISSELPPYPSLALGSADLSPLELAAAFAAIANHGLHLKPYLVERVAEVDGRELERHRSQAHKAMEPGIAYVLTHLLEGVIDRGTGAVLADLDLDLAGKTGTTDDYSDAWFVGFTPRYTLLAWVGYDVKRKIGPQMTGARAALPIWRGLVERGLAAGWLVPGERFVPPPGIVFEEVDHQTGLLAGPGSTRTVREAFLEGTQPVIRFDPQWRRVMTLPWYQQRPHYLPKAGERMPEDVEDWEPVLAGWSR